ncbi:MAG: hypothetical protein ACK6DP_18330 [Gemmatimonas sp.]|jgi:hypothetical protein|uniref:hypothetical protein n=1 Tax=Gemmatimonas sp. TaxID=1962908 RepID=UPI00391FA496|nr:hypothetical protein [Gemmatimonadota bacterium]
MARFGLLLVACPAPLAAQHDHPGHHGHTSTPVDCRTLAAPPWTGLSSPDRSAIAQLRRATASLTGTGAAAAAGFAPQFGDIPTMGVHWINRARMQDAVQANAPDHLLFARIDGRDSLVGVAYAFRGPVDATMPKLFESPLATWHDHPGLGGGRGNTLHMLHVWFVPSPSGPFAGNNFVLPFLTAGRVPPNPCWLQSASDVSRFELVATLVDILHRRADSTDVTNDRSGRRGRLGAVGARRGIATMLDELAGRVSPHLAAMDTASRADDRTAWERQADDLVASLRPGERRLVEGVRDRLTGIQSSTAGQRRRGQS